MNNLLEEAKIKVETLKVEALKNGRQNHSEPLDGQTLLEHHLQEKIQGHDASFGWNLSQEDRQLISQHIRTLSTLQVQIREEQLSLMKKTKFDNDLEFFSSAKKRNEAAYHLMESPFGKAIEVSPKDLAVEGYAERHRAKLKKDGLLNDEVRNDNTFANNLAKQGISRPSPKFPEKAHPNTHSNSSSFISKEDVLDAARGKYDSLATDLLGPSNRHLSSKHELRWGKSGSLRFHIAGPKEGGMILKWGESGNIFELVRREKNVKDFGAAVSYVASALNLKAPPHGITISPKQREEQEQKRAQLKERQALEEAKDIASRLNGVSELQMKSIPIEGTLAETYLRETRGIKSQLAPDLRFLTKGTTFMYGGEQKILQHDCFAASNSRSENLKVTIFKEV